MFSQRSQIRISCTGFYPDLWPKQQLMHSTEHIPQTEWAEPHLMENMVILHKAPFTKMLWYIFLTEWQLCVDPRSRRVLRASSNRQRIAHTDPRVPKTEAKLLAQLGVLVVLSPRNIAHFSWQERHWWVSSCYSYSIHDPWSHSGRLISTMALGGPSACQRKHLWLGQTELMLTEQASAGHVWTGDEVKRWNPPGSRGNQGAWPSKW